MTYCEWLEPTGKDDPAYYIRQGPAVRDSTADFGGSEWPYHEVPLMYEQSIHARTRLRIIKKRCEVSGVDYVDAVWKARDAMQ